MTVNKTLLIPNNSLEYYEDAVDTAQKKYLRATSIRSCLENIVDTVFFHISGINDVGKVKVKWKKARLSERLKMLEEYFPKEIHEKIIYIKDLGNKGTHPKLHNLITDEEINTSLKNLSNICEWTILSYFKKYGFDIHPWLPTILSTLPPKNRIRILTSLFKDLVISLQANDDTELKKYHTALTIKQKRNDRGEFLMPDEEDLLFGNITEESITEFDQIHLIVDKLSMAYLKNNEYEKSLLFIEECHEREIISDNFRDCMVIKMNEMEPHLDSFKISRNIEDTRGKYKELIKVVTEEDTTLFITIFTAVLAMN